MTASLGPTSRPDPVRPIPTRAMRHAIIGRSHHQLPLYLYTLGRGNHGPLILAGTHGDEPKSVHLARTLIELLSAPDGQESTRRNPAATAHDRTPAQATPHARTDAISLAICPLVNPDGYADRKRKNARGVDLNRNFPTKNWVPTSPRARFHGGSEPADQPETQAIISLVESLQPRLIVTIHSIDRHRHCNNYDGPAQAFAKRLARTNGYPVRASIGYSTPGSFGTWAGIERGIPTITLELPSHHSPSRCCRDNLAGLIQLACRVASP